MTREEKIEYYKKCLEMTKKHEKNAWLAFKCSEEEGMGDDSEYEYFLEESRNYEEIIKNLEEGKEYYRCIECEHYREDFSNKRVNDNHCLERKMGFFDTAKFIFCDRFKKSEARFDKE